jgi:hypothetical protein
MIIIDWFMQLNLIDWFMQFKNVKCNIYLECVNCVFSECGLEV